MSVYNMSMPCCVIPITATSTFKTEGAQTHAGHGVHIYLSVCLSIYRSICNYVYIYIYIYIYIHIYVCVYIYIYIHILLYIHIVLLPLRRVERVHDVGLVLAERDAHELPRLPHVVELRLPIDLVFGGVGIGNRSGIRALVLRNVS